MSDTSAELFQEILRRTHLSAPADLAGVVVETAGMLGASDVAMYLVDYEMEELVPFGGARSGAAPQSLAGTVAGRAFTTSAILRAGAAEPGGQRLWVPLLDGTERLGVLGLTFAEAALTDELELTCERFAHLVAMLTISKAQYGDAVELTRRRRPMTIASELLWGLAPPLVFATDGLTLAGMLEPAYDNGGDALDYAVDDRVLRVAVFDAMGHGLAAAGVAAFAVAAYRHSRRRGCGLRETYAAMDAAVGEQFPDYRFVTAVIAELDLDGGRLEWISAGHPPPLLIRDGRRTTTLETTPAPPLGVDHAGGEPTVASAALEPGDALLLYSDGLSDARGPDGSRMTLDQLGDFIAREAAAGQSAPETLRRVRHAIIGRDGAELRDDATALLLEWRRGTERTLVPENV